MTVQSQAACRYFTTPIFYASGLPHAGHLYTAFLLDILSDHYKSRGENVLALTGLDEHGEKIERNAKEKGVTPQAYVDSLAPIWKQTFADLGIKYDVFIRTTSADHKKTVHQMLQLSFDKGDIYFGEHEGHYCVGCEAFLTPKEMDEQKNCLIHQRPTELRKEGNYYFKVSRYKDALAKYISEGRIVSQKRYQNELLSLLENLEGDLSISRPKTRTTWGVELPFDNKHVAYVWFDALSNYVTGIGGVDSAKTSPHWANSYHLIGKEILKFHGIFWPAMLLSAGLPLPKLLVNGWLLIGSHKMSKSLGNVMTADQLRRIGRDAYVNAVIRYTNPGEDLDLSPVLILERYNSDLANGIGNLLSRTLGMIEKYFAKTIPQLNKNLMTDSEKQMQALGNALVTKVKLAFDEFRLCDALQNIWELVSAADKNIADSKPWVLAKDMSPEGQQKLANVLAISVAAIRSVGLTAHAFFPEKMNVLLKAIGEDVTSVSINRANDFLDIRSGFTFDAIPRLFDRVDIDATIDELATLTPISKDTNSATAETPKQKSDVSQKTAPSPLPMGNIGINDFAKIQVCVGTVINAEVVEGSDKLLKLQVSIGDRGTKQIFSGIRQWIKPEEMVNRKVLVLANLEPRKMRFGTSEGMLLSSETSDGRIYPVFVQEEFKEGALLS